MAPSTRKPRRPAGLDPIDLLERARDRQPPPVLLVAGQDCFSRDAVLAELRKTLVAEGFEGLDSAAVDAEEITGDGLVNQAEVLPMGGMAGGSRFLHVRRAEKMKERDLETLGRYATSPTPSTCMVLVFGESKGSVLTTLRKVAPLLEFPAPRDYQLSRWVEAQAARLGIRIEPDAARALAELSGENYVAAMSGLQVAALNSTGHRITRGMIEEQSGSSQDTNPFHLADAVLAGEPVRAVKILRDLHEAGESGYMILGLLEGQLRKFLRMRAEIAGGKTPRSVVQAASPTLPPAVQARVARQLAAFDEPRLISGFLEARAADRAIKSQGSGSEVAHLESLIWKLAMTGGA